MNVQPYDVKAWREAVESQDVWDEDEPCRCQSPLTGGKWACWRHMTGVVEVASDTWQVPAPRGWWRRIRRWLGAE